jgi:hypothetical protein
VSTKPGAGQTVDELDLPEQENRPLILIGHSLGCHVISTFVYDRNKLKQSTKAEIQAEFADKDLVAEWITEWEKPKPEKSSPFRRLDTLAGIITLGNNMPLFTFTFGPKRIHPIIVPPEIRGVLNDPDALIEREVHAAFPGTRLPDKLKEHAMWLNYFSKRDPLGFPLTQLYVHVDKIKDIPVTSEAPFFIPLLCCLFAHTRYWTNHSVLNGTAQLIRAMMEAPA